jgi:hypothetical protein
MVRINRIKNYFRILIAIGAILISVFICLLWFYAAYTHQQNLNMDLLSALKMEQVDEVKSLLKEGADPNAYDISHNKPEGVFRQIFQLIIWSRHTRLDRVTTAISYAADEGLSRNSALHAGLVKLLLDDGADVRLGEHCQRPALICAALYGDLTTTRLLLDHGANVNVYQLDGFSPLRAAIMQSDPEMVRFLLSRGAQVQIRRDPLGRNDFDWAHDKPIINMLKNAIKAM